ncbi:MAG: serine hydrolase, partial [Caulobacter sp.]|nr:serine hydrolase [Caulobacter sp.]
FTIRPPSGTVKTNTALGWRVDRDAAGRRRAHHDGIILGARSVIVLLPDEALAVSILTNLGQVDFDPVEPTQRIAEAFLA